jgi:hypothetical protein
MKELFKEELNMKSIRIAKVLMYGGAVLIGLGIGLIVFGLTALTIA